MLFTRHTVITRHTVTPSHRHYPSHRRRVGAFEVAIQPYGTTNSQLVFSKLSKKRFPTPSEVIWQLSSLLEPEYVTFASPSVLDIAIFDAYSHKPIAHAYVTLIRVRMTITSEFLDSNSDIVDIDGDLGQREKLLEADGLASAYYHDTTGAQLEPWMGLESRKTAKRERNETLRSAGRVSQTLEDTGDQSDSDSSQGTKHSPLNNLACW